MRRGWGRPLGGAAAGRAGSGHRRLREPLAGASWARKANLESPFSVFRAADTLYAGEPLKRRLTFWTLDGDASRGSSRPPTWCAARCRGRETTRATSTPSCARRRGRTAAATAIPAVVVELDAGRVDTIARLAPIDLAKVASPTGERFERRVFSGVDRWGVYPDGTVWLARVYHNRVDFRSPDGTTRRASRCPTACSR